MISLNKNGSVTLVSDADNTVTQLVAAGWTPASLSASYTAFQNTWPLAALQVQRQRDLDALFNANFDLAAFIRGGANAAVTAANVGAFLATITNNYRSLRSAIAAAPDVATLNAINVLAGWPANN